MSTGSDIAFAMPDPLNSFDQLLIKQLLQHLLINIDRLSTCQCTLSVKYHSWDGANTCSLPHIFCFLNLKTCFWVVEKLECLLAIYPTACSSVANTSRLLISFPSPKNALKSLSFSSVCLPCDLATQARYVTRTY